MYLLSSARLDSRKLSFPYKKDWIHMKTSDIARNLMDKQIGWSICKWEYSPVSCSVEHSSLPPTEKMLFSSPSSLFSPQSLIHFSRQVLTLLDCNSFRYWMWQSLRKWLRHSDTCKHYRGTLSTNSCLINIQFHKTETIS